MTSLLLWLTTPVRWGGPTRLEFVAQLAIIAIAVFVAVEAVTR